MRILIAGGGIAGFAMATALERRGLVPDLIERRSDTPQGGTGLYLPGNATRALQQLGLPDSLLTSATRIDTQRILDGRGRPLSVTRTQDVWSSCGPCLALPRATLHTALRDSLRETRARFGLSIENIELTGTTSTVTFSDGTSAEYDLVIGADGKDSTVRQRLFPQSRPQYAGNVSWRFITEDCVGISGWTVMLGDRMSLLALPIGDRRVYVYADMGLDKQAASQLSRELPTDLLLKEFSAPLAPLIAKAPDPADVHFSRIEQVVMDDWVKGHTVLIGDAAHAASPSMAEGAALAMEDALVLAETLTGYKNISEALTEYTRRRKSRVDWVQRQCVARDKLRRLPGWARASVLKLAGNALYARSYRPLTEPI